jgi:hypothetical protein
VNPKAGIAIPIQVVAVKMVIQLKKLLTGETVTDQVAIPMWVVYTDPADIPGKVVARLFLKYHAEDFKATDEAVIADTLGEVRIRLVRIDPGLRYVPRHVLDEPQITEIWM